MTASKFSEGLAPGDTVVTSGQFLMDVESRTTEAIDKAPSVLHKFRRRPDAVQCGTGMQTMSSTASRASAQLVIVHCPMKNADWFTGGDAIANPYFGTSMPTCGEISKTIARPMDGSALDSMAKDYLAVSQALDADKLDTEAVQALKAAANKLPIDQYAAVQGAVDKLAAATDLEGARLAVPVRQPWN